MRPAVSAVRAELFWRMVAKGEPQDCWEWQGCLSSNGYGCFSMGSGVKEGAHRVSFAIEHGYFPGRRRVVRHRCDNPKCVNPSHLLEGTHADNLRDARERGQWKPRTGKEPANSSANYPVDR